MWSLHYGPETPMWCTLVHHAVRSCALGRGELPHRSAWLPEDHRLRCGGAGARLWSCWKYAGVVGLRGLWEAPLVRDHGGL